MLADQMIYTACGKDRKGAYSVWSKSKNVTDAECEEIHVLMQYIQSEDTPYRPTEEQVNDRSLFPPKYGYFGLSSGRLCVAQSCYVGPVYSDYDKRYGNYIIHAFIFDNVPDPSFSPFSIFNLSAFKSKLTYNEWHDDPIPEYLPQIELKNSVTFDSRAISTICTTEKAGSLASLLQSALNVTTNNEAISFNHEENLQKEVYALIGMLLPYEIQRKLFFLSQFTMDLESWMLNHSMPQVKIRNIFRDAMDYPFNYRDQLNAGKAVFNFQSNIFAEIEAKRYVEDIIKTLLDNGFDSATHKALAVDKIMGQTNCDIDSAIAVYYLCRQDFVWFKGLSEYEKALEIVSKTNLVDKKDIASKLMTDIIKSKKWGSGKSIFSIIKFVYENSDQINRKTIIEDYWNNPENYGIDSKLAPTVFLQQLKRSAPFAWKDFENLVTADPKWEASIDDFSSLNKQYAIFDSAVEVVNNGESESARITAKRMIYKIYKKSISKLNFENIRLYNSRLIVLDDLFVNRLVEDSLGATINNPIKNTDVLEFVIKVILEIKDELQKIKLLTALTVANLNNAEFIPLYIKYSAIEQKIFNTIEGQLSSKNDFKNFLFKKDAYLFSRTQNVTFRQLNDYFNAYYLTGYDTGIYINKLNEYLRPLTGKTLFTESLRLYEQIRNLGVEKFTVLDILKLVERAIYSISIDELLKLVDGRIALLNEINNKINKAGCASSNRQKILFEILILRRKYNVEKIGNLIQTNALYNELNQAQFIEFVKNHFNEALEFYLYCREHKVADIRTLLASVFEKVISISSNSEAFILSEIEELPTKRYHQIIADMLTIGMIDNDKFAQQLKQMLHRYVNDMKRGEVQKLSSGVEKLVLPSDLPYIRAFFEDYFKTHKSLFEKLFKRNKDQGEK